MIRPLLCALLCLSAAFPAASAQAHHPASPSQAQHPPAQQLASLLQAQHAAVATGDPASIALATRPLAALLLRDLARLRIGEGKPAEAADLERQSLTLQDSPEVHLELASDLLRAGKPADAQAEAAAAAQADPLNPVAWAIQGSAFRIIGNEKQAVEVLNRSLQLKPDANVAYALGSALLALHRKDEAGRIFAQIISASGNAAIWHVAAGDAYREARYLTEAVDEFKKAIAIDSKVGHAEFFLGFTYLQMNEWGANSQSFEHLRNAVRLEPREYVSNFYLGALESTDGTDLESSNRHLRVAAEVNPTSPEVWLYLGLNAARVKDNADAKNYLRKAIELTGTDIARNNYQIRRVYAVLGRILVSEGDREEGNALLARYRETEQSALGNSAHTIAASAQDASDRSTFSGMAPAAVSFPGMASPSNSPALASSSTSILSPAPPSAQHTPEEDRQFAASERQIAQLLTSSLNDLGTAEARQGHYGDALAFFQQAERIGMPTLELFHNLGAAAFRVGRFDESARALELYLNSPQVPAHSQAPPPSGAALDHSRMMLAMSLFFVGNFPAASRTFESVSSLSMSDPRAAYSWAYSLAHSGQQPRAMQIADALTQQTLPADVLSLVCHIYKDSEDFEQAVTCFRKAYTQFPDLKLAHYQVAESLIRLNRPAEAIPELKQELLLSPENPDVNYSLAYALLETSHKEEALSLLRTIITSTPNHASAQYQLGKNLLESGDAAKAVEHLEIAEKNDPSADYIHYQLQSAYRKVGRTDDADRELRLYRDIKANARAATPTPPPQAGH
ncbi:MAG: hypothetical protein NVS9B15_09190 [Acidobacteriaceae bacterium]